MAKVRRQFKKAYEFHKQIFGIVLTAVFLTIFELTFFRMTVAPTIEQAVEFNFNSLNKYISSLTGRLDDTFIKFLNVTQTDEDRIVDKLNTSIIIDGSFIIVGLLCILFYIMYRLKGRHLLKDPSLYLFSFGSLGLFVLFQVYFFFLNQNYNYPTIDETVYKLKKSLLDNLD